MGKKGRKGPNQQAQRYKQKQKDLKRNLNAQDNQNESNRLSDDEEQLDLVQKKIKVNNDNGTQFESYSYVKQNIFFERYYQIQLQPYFQNDPSEFQQFWSQLKEKLPVVFRINPNQVNYESFLERMKSKDLLKQYLASQPLIIDKRQQKQQDKQPQQARNQQQQEETMIDESESQQDQENIQNQNQEQNQEQQQQINIQLQEGGDQNTNNNNQAEDVIENLEIENIKFYPNELVWKINTDKTQFKKNYLLKQFHHYIQQAYDSGLIYRQELVSMLPPLFLNPKGNDFVFDMCAAPGSKTAQLLEIMQQDKSTKIKEGVLFANDNDTKRAFMLSHQINKSNNNTTCILNHEAQFFPTLNQEKKNSQNKYDHKIYFDKILADVPCSGDGATRKIPEQWKKWSTSDGQGLHSLQLQILMRGISLCKIGGYIVYSTCSLNPMEDEAVVTEIFRRGGADALELIDLHSQYPDFKGRKGLSFWSVMSTKKMTYQQKSYDDLKSLSDQDLFIFYDKEKKLLNEEDGKNPAYQKLHSKIRSSMFPESKEIMENVIKIQYSMRVLPHDQNSGGFFIAMFKKKKATVWCKPTENLLLIDQQSLKSKQIFMSEEDLQKEFTHSQVQNQDEGQNENKQLQQEQNQEQQISQNNNQEQQQEVAQQQQQVEQIQQEEEEKVSLKLDFGQKNERFSVVDEQKWERLKELYGLEGLERSQFYCTVKKEIASKKFQMDDIGKKIYFISKGVASIIQCDKKNVLNAVALGVKAFQKINEGFQGNNKVEFRLCQDAAEFIFPFIRPDKKIKIEPKDLLQIIEKQNVKLEDLTNKTLQNQVMVMPPKETFLAYVQVNGLMECIVCLPFPYSISTLCCREQLQSIKMRYS